MVRGDADAWWDAASDLPGEAPICEHRVLEILREPYVGGLDVAVQESDIVGMPGAGRCRTAGRARERCVTPAGNQANPAPASPPAPSRPADGVHSPERREHLAEVTTRHRRR